MKLTALEIKQQTFEKSLRGYDVAEVKSFLNIVSSEWEHLVSKNKEQDKEIAQLKEKLKHYEKVEEALHETLQTAKQSAEQRVSGAREEARNKIEKAEIEAENILREARQQRQQIRQSVMRLLDRREEIIRGMRSYLDMAQESLQTFAKDESAIFSMPEQEDDEDLPDKKKINTGASSNNGGKVSDQKASGSRDGKKQNQSTSSAPGTEDIDELLDDID